MRKLRPRWLANFSKVTQIRNDGTFENANHMAGSVS